MCTKFNSLFIALTLLMAGCSQDLKNQSAEEILKDSMKQSEIMDAISNDDQMMKNMMTHMMNNDNSMQMMIGNDSLMVSMMRHKQMRQMMMQDTTLSKMMMHNMMEIMESDSTMCKMMSKMMVGNNHMINMMRQNGTVMDEGEKKKQMQMHKHDGMQ